MGTDDLSRVLSEYVDVSDLGGRMYAPIVACRYSHGNDGPRDASL